MFRSKAMLRFTVALFMMLGVNGASPTPPTNNPTQDPTLKPSKSPTTPYPSFSPTTTRPTSTPTANPITKDPTKTGTTKTPSTTAPTSHPTIATETPTANPTILTKNPTIKPTVFPTKAPTVTPPSTAQPTTTPTTPTAQPTLPTAQPTNFPTNEPTNEPTAAPTTVAPTEAPTAAPTTVAPTEAPTTAPTTVEPTEAPSTAPTNEPTKAPTTVAPTTRAPTLENMKDICEFEVLKGNGNNPCGNGFKVQSALYGKVAEELGWYGRDRSAKCGFMRDAPKTEESSEEDDDESSEEESSEEEIKVCTVDVTDAFVKDDSRNLQKNHQVSFFLKEYCKDQTGNEYCDYGTTSTGGKCELIGTQKQLRVFCVLDEESGSEAGSEAEAEAEAGAGAEAEEAKCVCTTKGTKVFVYDTDKCTFPSPSGESPGMPCDSCCTTYLDKIELNGENINKCNVAEENINKKLRSDGNFCVEASWVMISKRLAKLPGVGSDMLNNDSGFPYFQWNKDNTCRVHNVEQAKELEVTAHYSCKKPQQN